MKLENILFIARDDDNEESGWKVFAANMTNVTYFESAATEGEAYNILARYENIMEEGEDCRIQAPMIGLFFETIKKSFH